MENPDAPAIYANDSKPVNIFAKLITFAVVGFALVTFFELSYTFDGHC